MVTEPLCGREWLEAHELPKCIRCGQCCLHTPCFWGQLYYGLTKETDRCPALKRNFDGTYTCQHIKRDTVMRREMLETGCEYQDWRDNPIKDTLVER